MTKWIKRAFKCYRAFKQDPLLKNQHLKYSSVCILSMGFPEHFLGIWHGELEKKWNTCHCQHGCYSDVCSSHWNLEWCILQGGGGGAQPKEKLSEQWKRTSNKLNHMWHQFRKSNSNHSQCLQRCAIPGPRAPATRFHWVRTTTHWATVLCDKPDKPFRVRLTSPLWSWHKFKSN